MKAILVRHGEPDYEDVRKWGNIGLGFELGKLTEKGEQQAYDRAQDPNLQDAELIVSSPYTRALYTAAIISKETQIPLKIETDLHEWFGDVDFIFDYSIDESSKDYFARKGKRTKNHKFRFEEYEVIKKRVRAVLEKYKDYDKVIFVCHGIVISSMTHFDDMIEHCGIRELEV
ncbi:MAG: histidine phosphatase family protein [Acholeplasma sp.]|nr:histidine phosphatase family protein [Acholeplasma sp.]